MDYRVCIRVRVSTPAPLTRSKVANVIDTAGRVKRPYPARLSRQRSLMFDV